MELLVIFGATLIGAVVMIIVGCTMDYFDEKNHRKHTDHIHASIHDLGRPYILEPSKSELVVGEYKFMLIWRSPLSGDEYFAAHVYHDDHIVQTETFETLPAAEDWIDDRAAFLNQTDYTVEKESR